MIGRIIEKLIKQKHEKPTSKILNIYLNLKIKIKNIILYINKKIKMSYKDANKHLLQTEKKHLLQTEKKTRRRKKQFTSNYSNREGIGETLKKKIIKD